MKKVLCLILGSLLFFSVSAAAENATKEECIAKCKEAAKIEQEKGRDAAIAMVGDKNGPFVWKDTYVFCIDLDNGQVVAHPIKPKLVGKKLTGIKDINGKMFFLEFLNVAKDKGEGWVSYMWPKPGEKAPSPKSSYVYLPAGGKTIFIAGIYE